MYDVRKKMHTVTKDGPVFRVHLSVRLLLVNVFCGVRFFSVHEPLAYLQINDDRINERPQWIKNKSIARKHTICALCSVLTWVFYHLLKIIHIFISAIFSSLSFLLYLDLSFSCWFRQTFFSSMLSLPLSCSFSLHIFSHYF